MQKINIKFYFLKLKYTRYLEKPYIYNLRILAIKYCA